MEEQPLEEQPLEEQPLEEQPMEEQPQEEQLPQAAVTLTVPAATEESDVDARERVEFGAVKVSVTYSLMKGT